jgi:DnaJ-class molecular chaperone
MSLKPNAVSVDYYNILGVGETASQQEIQTAYRKKTLTVHPDKAVSNGMTVKAANEAFKSLGEAYETLSNPKKRGLYDQLRALAAKQAQAPAWRKAEPDWNREVNWSHASNSRAPSPPHCYRSSWETSSPHS